MPSLRQVKGCGVEVEVGLRKESGDDGLSLSVGAEVWRSRNCEWNDEIGFYCYDTF